MTDEQLRGLIEADDLGLIAIKAKRTPQSSEEERVLEGFRQILDFVEARGTAPAKLAADMNERLLHARLTAIRGNPAWREKLLPFDKEFELLAVDEESAPLTIDDLLNDDFLDSLEAEASDIFDLKHLPNPKDIEGPDYVAQRKTCSDFGKFEGKFVACHADLRAGQRKLLPFANEQQIEAGKFYVMGGVLLYVDKVGERFEKNGKWNARLRLVFENGTESDMLLRSLASELYKDGRRVTQLDEKVLDEMLVDEADKETGYIYVLRSLSDKPAIRAVPNLFKIGLARESVETRIKNAANEPTYLMAPVAVVRTYRCFNMNLPKLENLMHRFFDPAAVKVQVVDGEGNYHTPQEWFSVPIETVETAVRMLISGDIVNYRFDPATGEIQPKA